MMKLLLTALLVCATAFGDLVLYVRKGCPFCTRVTNYMTANDIKIRTIDINRNRELENELRAKGGKRQVPCLFIDGTPMYESRDIIQWLKKNRANG